MVMNASNIYFEHENILHYIDFTFPLEHFLKLSYSQLKHLFTDYLNVSPNTSAHVHPL